MVAAHPESATNCWTSSRGRTFAEEFWARHIVSAVVFVAGLAISGPSRAEFVPLFNGVDLAGWHSEGGAAEYRVENQVIIGSSKPGTPNTFLVTDREYSDFVLELDFKIFNTGFNSGVQLRSDRIPGHNGGRVFGYQVEIDPSSRAWTGGIYFEGGSPDRNAGWLDDLADNPAARAAFDLGEWNHFRIVARDRRIKTWLNGVPAADFEDNDAEAFLPTGVIGLQVHSNSSTTPLEVHWRNLLLEEAPPGDFNADGTVDAADYVVWRDTLGSDDVLAGSGADGDLDGAITVADYSIWKMNFGRTIGSGGAGSAAVAVPEVGCVWVLVGAGLSLAGSVRRRA